MTGSASLSTGTNSADEVLWLLGYDKPPVGEAAE
jgi:hypothetical protein